ncbi:hypothetical protein KI387_005289, partial [Taxus chinensis]
RVVPRDMNWRGLRIKWGCTGWSLAVVGLFAIVATVIISRTEDSNKRDNILHLEVPLVVNLTLVETAASKGAFCLDGSPPGYHLDRGFGSGSNSWLIHLEGGGWCNNLESCYMRKSTRLGSSHYMERQIVFSGSLSNKPLENP